MMTMIWTREACPFLYGVEEDPYEPPGCKLTVEQEKFRATEREKLSVRRIVVDEHGEDYHNIDEFTDEMLPGLNFRTYDNLFLANPEHVLSPGPKSLSECLVEHGCFISVSKSVSNGVSNDPEN